MILELLLCFFKNVFVGDDVTKIAKLMLFSSCDSLKLFIYFFSQWVF